MEIRIRDLVEAGLYKNEEEVMEEALRLLLQDRPHLRVALAVHRYRTDPELTLAQAAAIARVSVESMKEILKRYGVPLRLGPADRTEALAEIRALEDFLNVGACC